MNGKHDRHRGAPGLFAGILAASMLIAGCGQRGPLYLPQPPEPPRQAAPTPPAPDVQSERPGDPQRRP
jgi:predicted small lipoprotein YifL